MSKGRILIAEDDRDLRDFMGTRFLKHFNIEFAENGELAVALLSKFEPAVVVTDIVMPKSSGFQLISAAAARGIPVIVISAYGSSALQSALSLGATIILEKPFDFSILEQNIRKLLLQKSKHQVLYISSDMLALESFERFLNPKDFFIKTCKTKDFSLSTFLNHPHQIVLVDLDDPKGLAFSILEELKNIGTVDVIGLSQNNNSLARAKKIGCAGAIYKPFSNVQLQEALGKTLRR